MKQETKIELEMWPWKVSSNNNKDEYATVILGGKYNGIIAKTQIDVYTDVDQAEKNAQFIVKACNSYYDMLEALKPIKEAGHNAEFTQDGNVFLSITKQEYDAILATINKAEGGKP